MNYLIIGGSWAIYLALHSVFASNPVKRFFEKRIGFGVQGYRFVYSVFSSIGVLGVVFLMAIQESKNLFPSSQAAQYVGMVLAVWGVILVVASFRKLSGLAFLGFKKPEKGELVRDGIHGKIRHPIYSGTILIFLGMFLYTPTDVVLISILVIFCYLPIGIYYEEQKLIEEFGQEYLEYKKEVPAIIPGLF